MSGSELSEPLRQFVERYIPTLDHVAILLAAREQPTSVHSPSALAQHGRLDRSTADQVVTSLIASQLLAREGEGVRYAPSADARSMVDELAVVYRTMPVTLIRAIYARVTRGA
jgi:hypothetical protein